MAIDLATAQSRLQAYLDAEAAVLKGQAYTMGQRSLKLPDLPQIREGIAYWDGQVQALTANQGRRGARVRGAMPIG